MKKDGLNSCVLAMAILGVFYIIWFIVTMVVSVNYIWLMAKILSVLFVFGFTVSVFCLIKFILCVYKAWKG